MEEIKYSVAFDAQFMDGFGHRVQIIKLNPTNFASQPTSNKHNPWTQIPGYRIILKHDASVTIEQIVAFATFFRKNFIEKYPARYKKYAIKEQGSNGLTTNFLIN